MNKYIKFAFLFICSISFIIPNFINVKAADKSLSTNIVEPLVDPYHAYFILNDEIYCFAAYPDFIDYESTSNVTITNSLKVSMELVILRNQVRVNFNCPVQYHYSYYRWNGHQWIPGSSNSVPSGANSIYINDTVSYFLGCGWDYINQQSGINSYSSIHWTDDSSNAFNYHAKFDTIISMLQDEYIELSQLSNLVSNINYDVTNISMYTSSINSRIEQIRVILNNYYERNHLDLTAINNELYRSRYYDLYIGRYLNEALLNKIDNITIPSNGQISVTLFPYNIDNAYTEYINILLFSSDTPFFTVGSSTVSVAIYTSEGIYTVPSSIISEFSSNDNMFIKATIDKKYSLPYMIRFNFTGLTPGTYNFTKSKYYLVKNESALNSSEMDSITNNENMQNSFINSSNALDSIEDQALNNLNNSISNINTNIDLFSSSDFVTTTTFVRRQLTFLYEIPQLGYLVMYSLILGFAFVIIGIKTRN